ncbi:hypothetical protein HETIRDRAFT_416634 [Heterobasidion irregulare TC 32-1]|uniref:Uncharacterized protein n=1 Tax=Heterobasidion irregulare (strain TC 32-1) TaxID=747525 RepID=W4K9E9_HETIT|nr:uncharacterized protein HETIRDRAFT_416634 [Heterobasidion irregulare TC 32-1]ETW82462.1 hypothetical protein HETIRDRAFT_416634 [Heterobasidion irregulare TC 32-1]
MVCTRSPGVQATPRHSHAIPSISHSRYSARLKHTCQKRSMSRCPNNPVECRRCREEHCVFLRLVFKQGHVGEWISICHICDNLWYPPQDLPPAEQVLRIEEIRADDERIRGHGGTREKTVVQFSQSQGNMVSKGTEGGSSPVRDGHILTSPVPSIDDFFGKGVEDSQGEGGGVLHTNNGLDRWVWVIMWTAMSLTCYRGNSGLLTLFQANAMPEIVLCKAPYSFFKFMEHRCIMAEMEECRWEIYLNIDKEIWVSEREHSILGHLARTPGCAGEVGNKRARKKRGIEKVEVMEGSSGLSIDEKEVVMGWKAHAAAKGKCAINVYCAISDALVADELVTLHLIIEDGKEIYDLTWE